MQVVLTCFKSMTWVIETKNPANKIAVINLKVVSLVLLLLSLYSLSLTVV